MAFKAAPLPHEYMMVGIIGFFIAVFLVGDADSSLYSPTWSFALGLFFLLLIIASFVSMSSRRIDEEALDLIGGEHYQSKRRETLATRYGIKTGRLAKKRPRRKGRKKK